MAGLILVSGEGGTVDGGNQIIGDILIVAATMFAAGYVVLSVRLALTFPPATLAGAQQIVGLVFATVAYGFACGSGLIGGNW
jgi:drug/metabolite transporter (DMT)-like permease